MKRENSGKKGSYKKKNQWKKMENIELKISVTEIKILLDQFNTRLEVTEGKISEHKDN